MSVQSFVHRGLTQGEAATVRPRKEGGGLPVKKEGTLSVRASVGGRLYCLFFTEGKRKILSEGGGKEGIDCCMVILPEWGCLATFL